MGRSRTYEWEDPSVSASEVGRASGLDFLRALIAGRIPGPPIGATIGFVLEEVDHGHAVFSLEPGEEHYNPIGSVHGGSTRPCSTPLRVAPSRPRFRRAWPTPRST